MKFPMLVSVSLAMVCATAALTHAQGTGSGSSSPVAEKVRALEYARFQAQEHNDNIALDAVLDNSLVWVETDGTLLTKAELMAKIHRAGANVLEITVESMIVRTFGDTANVVGVYRIAGTKAGKPYQQRCRFMDTWIFKNGMWVCIAAMASSSIL
jgi:hypothetical protein